MKYALFLFIIFSAALAEKYALIFQGDREYDNYSDSSNTCRGYNDIVASGLKPENVIYMANEETLTDSENPFPNKLFTLADYGGKGWDHAKGCKDHFDYYGKMIEPEIVLAILRQDEEKVKALTGLANPKVFHTTEEDTIFIYYSDHGYEGGVSCGEGVLTTEDIQSALKYLHEKKAYKYLAFFLEACHSGSVFDSLPADLNIYALTSANRYQLAYCDYCPPEDIIDGTPIGTCLSMLYDNAFEKYWERESTTITLEQLQEKVQEDVKEESGQTICAFGDLSMGSFPMTTFLGTEKIKVSQVEGRSTSRVTKDEAPLLAAKWKAIRASSRDSSAWKDLEEILKESVRKEVSVMRLGVSHLGEKAWDQLKGVSELQYDAHCATTLFEGLMKHCHYTLPFTKQAITTIHAICSVTKVEDTDWESVCV